jgi:hypothetical protein
MKIKRLVVTAVVTVLAGAGLSLGATSADASVLTLGNSHSSNQALSVWHGTNCSGRHDWVEVGELANNGIGTVGSVSIPKGAYGSATPFYTIAKKDHAWCWHTPTAVATSVHLHGAKGSSWFK